MLEKILTKELLTKLYFDDKKSLNDMAKIYGCDAKTIKYYMDKYSLVTRSLSDVQFIKWGKNISKDVLIELYVKQHMTSGNIAQILNCGGTTIRGYLNRYNIPIRHMREAQRIRRLKTVLIPDDFLAILNGLLLSDGSLINPNNFQAYYSQSSNQEGFIMYLVDVFKKYCYFQSYGSCPKFDEKYNKTYVLWHIYSMCTAELRELYDKWYPDGKKHIPEDIALTPNTVLFWYLGDGTKVKNKYCSFLCTDAFQRNELEILAAAFAKVGIEADIIKFRQYYRLRISRKENFNNFMKYMGKNPVSCYDYKFDYNIFTLSREISRRTSDIAGFSREASLK